MHFGDAQSVQAGGQLALAHDNCSAPGPHKLTEAMLRIWETQLISSHSSVTVVVAIRDTRPAPLHPVSQSLGQPRAKDNREEFMLYEAFCKHPSSRGGSVAHSNL